jgi:N-acetyltransferase 10
VFKALDALGYEEHVDYDVVQSTNPEFKKAIVRVNIFRGHRQTIQYIAPEDAHVLGQAELVIIDEAAAIPLPLVRKLIGPYLVFMASTINGYEGTGRSLSIKLIQQLREQTRPTITKAEPPSAAASTSKAGAAGKGGAGLVRSLREIKLDEPIRYSPGDEIEKWLNHLLCLDATVVSKAAQGCPHPSQCELYYVNRDTLFSYHAASEVFLQRMMALYVASHYKNSPNDLQMLSDAPAHHLFVLLPPLKEDDNSLPDPLVVVQVALEGNISREAVLKELSHSGTRSAGDMIPWVISQQFQDSDFAMLSGARIVRIATHPDYARMGYGARALEALNAFYSGELTNLDEVADEMSYKDAKVSADASLSTDKIAVRDVSRMPPLLQRLSERKPENLDYLGVSFGLTPELLRFWKKAGYVPLYASQKENALTGEHTFVFLRPLLSNVAQAEGWLGAFAHDFRRRFLNLLSYECFKKFPAQVALSIIDAASRTAENAKTVGADELGALLSPFDTKRLESYADGMVDYHVILDLVPTLAMLNFGKRFGPEFGLSAVQAAILLSLGLQRRPIEALETELGAPPHQVLALFAKLIRRVVKHVQDVHKEALGADMPLEAPAAVTALAPAEKTVAQDIAEAASEEKSRAKAAQRELLDAIDMNEFAIDTAADFTSAEKQIKAVATAVPEMRSRLSTTVSVKGTAAAPATAAPAEDKKQQKQKRRESGGGGKHKKAKRE